MPSGASAQTVHRPTAALASRFWHHWIHSLPKLYYQEIMVSLPVVVRILVLLFSRHRTVRKAHAVPYVKHTDPSERSLMLNVHFHPVLRLVMSNDRCPLILYVVLKGWRKILQCYSNLYVCTVHQWRIKHFIIQQMHKYIIRRYTYNYYKIFKIAPTRFVSQGIHH